MIYDKDNISGENVCFYLNYVLGSPPLELHIASIDDLLSRGNKITVYVCNKSLKSCTANPLNSPSVCRYCNYRITNSLNSYKKDIKIKEIHLADFDVEVPDDIVESLNLGVMSSMASAVKAQSYDQLNSKWKSFHDKMLYSAKQLYNYFMHEIYVNKFEYVFMFNGRFGDVKPVLEAARKSNINYGLLEVKKSLHELVFINELIHSIDGNTRRALSHYQKDSKVAFQRAKEFFSKKVNSEDTGDPIYTKGQVTGLLPDSIINTSNKIVAVYPTTDDEYKFIGAEWDGFVPEDQVDEINSLAKLLSDTNHTIIVKMHPNQAHTAEDVISRYLQLEEKYPHIIVEKPLSRKDSYALMRASDFVINFASTIGVEACYAGKVVISIGDTTFSKMNIGHNVKSGQEAAVLILSKNLKPKPKLGAVIWGNYLSTYSDNLPAFKRVSNGVFYVNEEKIGRNRLLRILQLPAKLKLEILKPGFRYDLSFLINIKDLLLNIIFNKYSVK